MSPNLTMTRVWVVGCWPDWMYWVYKIVKKSNANVEKTKQNKKDPS
jgi:hypothetical protein